MKIWTYLIIAKKKKKLGVHIIIISYQRTVFVTFMFHILFQKGGLHYYEGNVKLKEKIFLDKGFDWPKRCIKCDG